MSEKYLGNVAEVESLDNVSNLIIESTNNGIKKIPTKILKQGIYKDLPIDSALSETSDNAVKNKVIYKKFKEIDQYKANSIISTSSGTVFHETDCAAVPPVNIELFGKSTQKTYTGKNMFNYVKGTHSTSSATTVEVLDNGVIARGDVSATKPGQDVASSGWVVLNEKEGACYLEAGAEITFSFDYTVLENSLETDYPIRMWLEDVISSKVHKLKQGIPIPKVNTTTRISYTITISTSGYYTIGCSLNSCLVKVENAQIELGDTATEYEPYVGNKPSPNIHYPQQVTKLGASGRIKQGLYGGNLVDQTKATFMGKTQSAWINNALNISYGIPSSYRMVEMPFFGKLGETFFVSYNVIKNTTSSRVKILFPELNVYTNGIQNGKYCKQITLNGDVTKIALYIDNDVFVEGAEVLITDFMLSISDLPYEPYTEQPFTALTPNGLGGIPIGVTIPDTIKNSPIHMNGVYWDEEEGRYYIGDYKNYRSKQNVQLIGEDVLTGDERFIYASDLLTDNYNAFYSEKVIPIMNSTNNKRNEPMLSTHFIKKASHRDDCCGSILCLGVNMLFFWVPKTDFPDVDTFKAHVKAQYDAGTPIKSYYILAEPIITDLTEEEIAQYDSLVMNYPNTTIVNDAGAYMECSYISDTKCYIDNLEKKHEEDIQTLRNAILSLGGNV